MERHQLNNYEGYRRKNSLNHYDSPKQSPRPSSAVKHRYTDNLKQIEDISMQLQQMSLRSTQSARNFKHVIKNISIKSIDEGYLNHKNKNQHAFSMTNIHEDTVDDYKPKKNHKMNTLTVFNKFDTIQEEQMDAHSKSPRPNSLKNKKNTNLALNSPKPNLKATTTVRQNMGVNRPSKGNNLNKNKISQEIMQLDVMKKELEGKKYYQAANRPGKTSGNTATPKGLKEIPKARMSVHPPTPKTTAPKTTRTMSKQTFSSKYAESKSPLVIVKEISKQSITEEKIPKRMLTVGEKQKLLWRLQELREIIRNNQICSDGFSEVMGHLVLIEKSLMR